MRETKNEIEGNESLVCLFFVCEINVCLVLLQHFIPKQSDVIGFWGNSEAVIEGCEVNCGNFNATSNDCASFLINKDVHGDC